MIEAVPSLDDLEQMAENFRLSAKWLIAAIFPNYKVFAQYARVGYHTVTKLDYPESVQSLRVIFQMIDAYRRYVNDNGETEMAKVLDHIVLHGISKETEDALVYMSNEFDDLRGFTAERGCEYAIRVKQILLNELHKDIPSKEETYDG